MKRKLSWKVLETFMANHYIIKHGAGNMDIAIHDLITDLYHIRYERNVNDPEKMYSIMENAKDVFWTEQDQIDSDRIH